MGSHLTTNGQQTGSSQQVAFSKTRSADNRQPFIAKRPSSAVHHQQEITRRQSSAGHCQQQREAPKGQGAAGFLHDWTQARLAARERKRLHSPRRSAGINQQRAGHHETKNTPKANPKRINTPSLFFISRAVNSSLLKSINQKETKHRIESHSRPSTGEIMQDLHYLAPPVTGWHQGRQSATIQSPKAGVIRLIPKAIAPERQQSFSKEPPPNEARAQAAAAG